MSPKISRAVLDRLYTRYNRRGFVHPDPLEFLYDYEDPLDREVAGMVASSLAYGRVVQILRSVSSALRRMGPSPSSFLRNTSREALRRTYAGFRHRFSTGEELSGMLTGVKGVIERHGSLHRCFLGQLREGEVTVLPALLGFVSALRAEAGMAPGSLLPSPTGGSAFKRVNLFLRWMVRRDRVDPGGWENVSAAKLIVPLDTHMHRTCLCLGLTKRKQADIRTAIEITDAFRKIAPHDPVRYDFALTRMAIMNDPHFLTLLNS